MNIYFIADKEIFKNDYVNQLSKLGNILYSSNNNEENYKKLKEDNNEKIIIYDPDYAGWSFPNNILIEVQNLKAIFLGTTDKSYINLDICKDKNIDVINIPKYASESVAEYLVMYMFVLSKKIPLQIKNNNKQDFSEPFLQMELKNKKVGIVGLGNIGYRIAQICDGIGMDIYYWNRTKKDNNYKFIELDKLFKECDIIYICLAINKETKKIITNDLLDKMKKNCILISGTGKQLFDSKVIENKVRNNEIFGYAFEEPNTLLEKYSGNIMVTSEYGWYTNEASDLRIKRWVELIIDYIN